MGEFRFNGVSKLGQPVQGMVFAPNRRAAQQKVDDLSKKHSFQLRQLEQRRVFHYKVRHPNGKEIKGEQKAFSEEEIRLALERMGLDVVKVNKKLLNYQPKPPSGDIILFVRMAANLLAEKMQFGEVLNLLIADISSRTLKTVIRDINNDLKGGMEAKQAFMKHQGMLGKFTAYMLGVASQSGNMSEIYEATALFLERKDEFRKSIKSAMVTPAITVLAAVGVFIWYVWSIIPQTAGLFSGFDIDLPPLTTWALGFSAWLDSYGLYMLLVFIAIGTGAMFWAKSPKGRFLIHQYMIRVPVIGGLLHKLNIEVFCRVFAILYSSSGQNIEVLKIAAEACGNTYLEHQVKTITIPMMVAQGADLIHAMEAAQVFTPMTLARFRSGVETGTVRKSAQQMADYYQKEVGMKMKMAVETIQSIVAVLIGLIVTFLTVISAESALIRPDSQDLMGTSK